MKKKTINLFSLSAESSASKASTYTIFLFNLYPVQAVVLKGVDHYQYVCKLCLEYAPSIISPVLRPNYVNLIIP